ncbi:MAG: hypothetical protein RIK87_07520 [Fuerstiella sp.]
MNIEEQDSSFSSRVSQGHLDNFLRKVEAAESPDALRRLQQVIDFAFERQMIDEAGREKLLTAISHQAALLPDGC